MGLQGLFSLNCWATLTLGVEAKITESELVKK